MALMVFMQGERITPFIVSWSATTIRASKVLPHRSVDGGRSVMKLIVTILKGQAPFFAGMGMSGGTVGWVLIFACWHMAHPRT